MLLGLWTKNLEEEEWLYCFKSGGGKSIAIKRCVGRNCQETEQRSRVERRYFWRCLHVRRTKSLLGSSKGCNPLQGGSRKNGWRAQKGEVNLGDDEHVKSALSLLSLGVHVHQCDRRKTFCMYMWTHEHKCIWHLYFLCSPVFFPTRFVFKCLGGQSLGRRMDHVPFPGSLLWACFKTLRTGKRWCQQFHVWGCRWRDRGSIRSGGHLCAPMQNKDIEVEILYHHFHWEMPRTELEVSIQSMCSTTGLFLFRLDSLCCPYMGQTPF